MPDASLTRSQALKAARRIHFGSKAALQGHHWAIGLQYPAVATARRHHLGVNSSQQPPSGPRGVHEAQAIHGPHRGTAEHRHQGGAVRVRLRPHHLATALGQRGGVEAILEGQHPDGPVEPATAILKTSTCRGAWRWHQWPTAYRAGCNRPRLERWSRHLKPRRPGRHKGRACNTWCARLYPSRHESSLNRLTSCCTVRPLLLAPTAMPFSHKSAKLIFVCKASTVLYSVHIQSCSYLRSTQSTLGRCQGTWPGPNLPAA